MKIEVENAQQNEQVDWNKNPQLVEYNGVIILVHQCQENSENDNHFVGTNLEDSDFSNKWIKKVFKPFHGKITLSND
jgi:hypothetical protein